MKRKNYVAYGSNLNVAQMRFRCPDAKIIGTGFLKDYRLLFRGSKTGSYLTIEPKVGSKVPIVVWSVSDNDEMSLDRYEGFPTFYYKKEISVVIEDIKSHISKKVNSFVYIMHEDRPLGVPTARYLNTCVNGYRAFGFNEEFLYKAIKDSEPV